MPTSLSRQELLGIEVNFPVVLFIIINNGDSVAKTEEKNLYIMVSQSMMILYRFNPLSLQNKQVVR